MTLRLWFNGPWATPAIAGLFILSSWTAEFVLDSTLWGSILMVAAAVVAGFPIARQAVRALSRGSIAIDLLVTIAAIGAIVIGNYWEAAAVTFLFAFGHALEARTMNKTRSALSELIEVAPDTAIVLRGGEQVEVPAHTVRIGETVVIKNGAKAPVDGMVVTGRGTLDQSSITGESIPAEKTEGDLVFAGTMSTGGLITVKATGVGADTTLAKIITRVEEAAEAKAKTQAFIDRFSQWYTPGIIILAIAGGLITGNVTLALTLLVIGCPGALVISIPVAIVAGIGRAATEGILIKGGEYVENAAKITAVALDKTGTLTEGRPTLTDIVALGDHTADEVVGWAGIAESGSEHPLSAPIVSAAAEKGLLGPGFPDTTENVTGMGIIATEGGRRILVGNTALLEREGILIDDANHHAERLAAAGKTAMLVAVDDETIGVIAVADTIRTDARRMVDELRRTGVTRVVMLTGDSPLVARAIAAQTGIDDVRAGLLPDDKLEAIQDLQAQGYRVAMVGDGVNDAPALAVADIGVAMGAGGTDVAIETADIALIADDLMKLPRALDLAKRTVAVMKQNIVIALVTVVALLAGVFAGGVTMTIGMLVHELSVLIVILNAMRLLRKRPPRVTKRLTEESRLETVRR
ncbi:heavy metal translocating P-type ATPase [Flaviflexus equikiangi]|uniref:Cation-translocating P-type ATPase n=1 Tax=Flaviflexus equikiangi TaxID=2758573 RepID=A0ABS2TDB6_9ACTO|nr:cation-translocating P-type ATPase [Flaviflexus equikiangi]MBM9432655.1 cation-translocating P-type ATPase [Flaviflexus equikiangi]